MLHQEQDTPPIAGDIMEPSWSIIIIIVCIEFCPYLGLESLPTVAALPLNLPPGDPVMLHPRHVPVPPHPRLVEGRLALDLLLDPRPAGPVGDHLAGDALEPVPDVGGERTVLPEVAGLHPAGARDEHVDIGQGEVCPVTDTSTIA